MGLRIGASAQTSLLTPSRAKSKAHAVSSFLLPFLYQTRRPASTILSDLRNTPGSYSHKKRVGRGPSSGKGKTSGRGHNGQKARHGTPFRQALGRHFEGGQTPVERVHGKRGFHNRFSKEFQTVSLAKIISWISQNRIDPTRPITARELQQSRCVSRPKDGIKLLADGKESLPSQPLRIMASRASAAAIAAVEGAGGKVATRYYTSFALRQIARWKMDPVHSLQSRFDEEEWGPKLTGLGVYRLPDPASRKALEYYRDADHRGYLSYMVPEGQEPSLFFKTPGIGREREKKVSAKPRIKAEDNRLF